MNHPEEFLWTDKKRPGSVIPANSFLFFTFLFDQVHQRVAPKIHWAHLVLLIGPVRQKITASLPLSDCTRWRFQYSPYDPTSHPLDSVRERGPSFSSRAKFWDKSRAKSSFKIMPLAALCGSATVEKVQHFLHDSPFSLWDHEHFQKYATDQLPFDRSKPCLCHLPRCSISSSNKRSRAGETIPLNPKAQRKKKLTSV